MKAKILKFRLKLRAPAPTRRRGAKPPANLVPFPLARRCDLVAEHARAMRPLSGDERETYLDRVVAELCDGLNAIGIDCEECQCELIVKLLEAIGKQLYGPDFELDEAAV